MASLGPATPTATAGAANTAIDPTRIPSGDGKLSTSVAAVGSVFSCTSTFTGGGASAAGPWINAGGTWNSTTKIAVEGSVAWPITTNDLPDHTTGTFPIAKTDPAYAYDQNPGAIGANALTYNVPQTPVLNASPTRLGLGPIGILLTGAALFNALDNEGRDAVGVMVTMYHYHATKEYPSTLGCYRGTPAGDAPATAPNAGARGEVLPISMSMKRRDGVFSGSGFAVRLLVALALAGAGVPAVVARAAPNDDPAVVQTDRGSVRGSVASGGRTFLGIPFAAPPVGPLRFRAPKPAAPWTGVRDATQAAAECPQIGSSTQNTTEDCLYLNVWTPPDAKRAPVLVFIFGGGFTQGNSAAYDGSRLAADGKIVVVTMNYRSGIFGFLASRALDGGSGATGNYGIEDQQAALHWVQRNIAAFGGNPRNVTLGGESAGAASTCANLAAPGAGGTFVRAIVQSGPCAVALPTLAAVEAKHAPIPAALGCTGSDAQIAACLRSPNLSVQQILAVQQTLPRGTFSPSAEGADIPVQPRTYLGRIPLLLGGNRLEAGYTILPNPPADATAYAAALQQAYGPQAGAVAARYPVANYPSAGLALATVESDEAPAPTISVCEDVASWRLTRAAGGAPMYAYEFNDPSAYAFTGARGPVHTAELPYFYPNWNNVYPPAGKGLAPASQALSATMIAYWRNFITSGDPNGAGLPLWPTYHLDSDVMQFAPDATGPGTDVNAEHKCAFWNSLGRAL